MLDLDPKTVQEQLEITSDLQKVSEKNVKPPLPHHLEDHTYSNYEDTSFTVDQQYADDIGWASTAEHIIENIEITTTEKLKERNLLINQSKTEKYNIKKDGDDSWKKCKYVGSLLGTTEDINRRKQLTHTAFFKLKPIFTNNYVSVETKLRIFNALLSSIFLYNCELWTLTSTLEKKIDAFQRQLLRRVLNIRWDPNNNWITNEQLYEKAAQKPWSKTIATRRLRVFGHICRLPNSAPAKKALYEGLRPTKKPVGGQRLTLLKLIEKQLPKCMDIYGAINLAQNRDAWRVFVNIVNK